MRTWRVASIIALCLGALPGVCRAGEWSWQFTIAVWDWMTPGVGVEIGVSPDALDNYDAADRRIWWTTPERIWWTKAEQMRIYHSVAEGWLGPEDFYNGDVRSPITGSKTWDNIYLWWSPLGAYYDRRYEIRAFPGQTPYFPPSAPPPAYYRFTLYLDRVPAGISYNGPWQWELSPTSATIISADTFTPFGSDTGLDGYKFHLTVVTPEPSGLLALAGGLAIVCIRRRGR